MLLSLGGANAFFSPSRPQVLFPPQRRFPRLALPSRTKRGHRQELKTPWASVVSGQRQKKHYYAFFSFHPARSPPPPPFTPLGKPAPSTKQVPPLPNHRRQIRHPKASTSVFEFRPHHPASEVFEPFLGCSKEEPSFMCLKTC
jgi:hypothetical protein